MTATDIKLVARPKVANQYLHKLSSFLKYHRTALRVTILSLIALMGFCLRLFSIVRYESIIHEFDPWFNYRATMYLADRGWSEFMNWFDETAWYPLGRSIGGTVYPGIMVTSALCHFIFNKILGFPVEIRDVCVFLAPVCSGLTAYATYLLTKELKDASAGLIAAAFIVICPGYISRSVAGAFDNEAIAIFLMVSCFYLWVMASKTGSSFYAVSCSMAYFYMVSSWGGYSFVINMIPLHVFTLLCMGRYSHNLYRTYCTFYVLGALSSMTVPFVGFQPTFASEHMPALGIFCLLQLFAVMEIVRGLVDESKFKSILKMTVSFVSIAGLGVLAALMATGKISPLGGRVYSLWDTKHATKHIPIIASVAEHQPTSWGSFYMDFQWLFYAFPAGVWWCLRKRKNEHIFVILYATFASYFAAVMVRLILTLAPIVCVAGSIACSNLLDFAFKSKTGDYEFKFSSLFSSSDSNVDQPQVDNDNEGGSDSRGGGFQMCSKDAEISNNGKVKRERLDWVTKALIVAPVMYHLIQYVYHCVWITQMAYSSPSVVVSSRGPAGKEIIIDDFREAYYWIRRNTPQDSKILAWWDYGYQIAGFCDRTTIVDNNTWNNTHIATVGKIFAAEELVSYKTMRELDVDYVMVLSGVLSGYAGDDINKFMWILRIAAGVYPDEIKEPEYFNAQGYFATDHSASEKAKKSLLYKMVYKGMATIAGPALTDHARKASVGDPDPKLNVLEEVFSSERFMVRVYKVKQPDTLGRPLIK